MELSSYPHRVHLHSHPPEHTTCQHEQVANPPAESQMGFSGAYRSGNCPLLRAATMVPGTKVGFGFEPAQKEVGRSLEASAARIRYAIWFLRHNGRSTSYNQRCLRIQHHGTHRTRRTRACSSWSLCGYIHFTRRN